MVKRVIMLLAILSTAATLAGITPANAQGNSKTIKYGDTVAGELTTSITQLAYTFTAQKNDEVVVELLPKGNKGLNGPLVTLNSVAQNKKVASSDDLIIFGRTGVVLGAEISKDGDYNIVVTADKNASEKTGTFEVILTNAPILTMDKPVTGTVKSGAKDSRGRYSVIYAVQSKDDFIVTYEKTGGDFNPIIEINNLNTGNMLTVDYMGGQGLTRGSLGADGSKDVRFVTLGNEGVYSVDKEQSADYTLKLSGVPSK